MKAIAVLTSRVCNHGQDVAIGNEGKILRLLSEPSPAFNAHAAAITVVSHGDPEPVCCGNADGVKSAGNHRIHQQGAERRCCSKC